MKAALTKPSLIPMLGYAPGNIAKWLKEPASEPIQKRPDNYYKNMEDGRLAFHAKIFCDAIHAKTSGDLHRSNPALWKEIQAREFFEDIGLKQQRSGGQAKYPTSDAELIRYAKGVMGQNGIKSRTELQNDDAGLYHALWARGLLGELNHGQQIKRRSRQHISWKDKTDRAIVRFANKYSKDNRLLVRNDLFKSYQSLHHVLCNRNLFDRVRLAACTERKSKWKSKSDGELVAFAKKFAEEKSTDSLEKFRLNNSGLYSNLQRRGLLDDLGLQRKHKKPKRWEKMSNRKVLEFAKNYMEENGIKNISAMVRHDCWLYGVLRRKKLLQHFKADKKTDEQMAKMSSMRLINYAKKLIGENGIVTIKGMYEAFPALYNHMKKKELIKELGLAKGTGVYARTDFYPSKTDRELIEHAKGVIHSEGIQTRSDFRKKHGKLHGTLAMRKLLGSVGLKNKRKWNPEKYSLEVIEKLLSTAKKTIETEKIESLEEIRAKNLNLYNALGRKNLLDRIGLKRDKDLQTAEF